MGQCASRQQKGKSGCYLGDKQKGPFGSQQEAEDKLWAAIEGEEDGSEEEEETSEGAMAVKDKTKRRSQVGPSKAAAATGWVKSRPAYASQKDLGSEGTSEGPLTSSPSPENSCYDSGLFVHDVVRKPKCEKFEINFGDEAAAFSKRPAGSRRKKPPFLSQRKASKVGKPAAPPATPKFRTLPARVTRKKVAPQPSATSEVKKLQQPQQHASEQPKSLPPTKSSRSTNLKRSSTRRKSHLQQQQQHKSAAAGKKKRMN